MSRAQRAKSETAIYHALVRGINQQTIFEDSEDCQQFLDILAEVKVITKFELYAYCLMDNHVHLLLKETDEPLAQIFKRLGVRYVQWFNQKYQRSGHLFQDRFKSEPINDEAYFITVIRYIANNPVKAGLCNKPENYQWSSLRLLKTKDPLIDWIALEKIVPLSDISPLDIEALDDELLESTQIYRQTCSDQKARRLLEDVCGARNVSEFQKVDKDTQKMVIPKLRTAGASIRQIARITGLSKGRVERWNKKR
jgi:REP element-mobilizing transposase RayT